MKYIINLNNKTKKQAKQLVHQMGYPSVLKGGDNVETYANVTKFVDDIKAKVKENTGQDVYSGFLQYAGPMDENGELPEDFDPSADYDLTYVVDEYTGETETVTYNGFGIDMKTTWDTMLDEAYGITDWADNEELDALINEDDLYITVDRNGNQMQIFDTAGDIIPMKYGYNPYSDGEENYYSWTLWRDPSNPKALESILAKSTSILVGDTNKEYEWKVIEDLSFDTAATYNEPGSNYFCINTNPNSGYYYGTYSYSGAWQWPADNLVGSFGFYYGELELEWDDLFETVAVPALEDAQELPYKCIRFRFPLYKYSYMNDPVIEEYDVIYSTDSTSAYYHKLIVKYSSSYYELLEEAAEKYGYEAGDSH